MGADLAAEEQFGPYTVFERLGVGGMATVHRALEQGIEGFERIVALKRLLPHLAEDASFIKSFVREAKLASLLNHNNVVQIFELGRVGTQYFISMEYIDGRDIRAVLRHARKVTGPPPIHVTVGLLLQLCDALDYAHTRVDEKGQPLGLVHRDVSPSNVLVTSAGHVKVIDFGIAKAQSQQLRTQTGRVKGKLAYMAPEAISGGKDLDARSDIFAVGVIAHELLTARPLFASKNEYQTLLKVQKGDITPPSAFNQACPPELDAIVLHALERDPEKRFASAAEIREELLRLKFKLGLQTGHRDIAAWLEWAARQEVPGPFGGASSVDHTGGASKVHRTPTPAPKRAAKAGANSDEEEAVDIAWGGGGDQEVGGPVLLDDVPDVSDKHRAISASQLAVTPVPTGDEGDDIPAPSPSHGRVSRALPIPAPPDDDDGPRSHPSIAPGARKPASVPPGQRFATGYSGPDRRKSPSADAGYRGAERRSQEPPLFDEPIGGPSIDRRAQTSVERRGPDRRVTQQPPPDGVERRVGDRRTTTDRRAAASPISVPPSERSLKVPTDRRSPTSAMLKAAMADLDADLLQPPSAAPTRAATQSSGPLERTPSDPYQVSGDPRPARSPTEQAAAAYEGEPADTLRSMPPVDPGHVPSTKPGFAPPKNLRRSDAPNLLHPPVVDASTTKQPRRPTTVSIGSSIIERQQPRKTWMLFVGLGVSGAIAAGLALYITRGSPATPSTTPGVSGAGMASVRRERGTVKFEIEPADAEITIQGMEPHKGSPWQIELPPGVHSIQIQREGHKAYLTSIELSDNETQTLHVALKQISSQSIGDDAMLALSSSPPGLEAVLDGQVLAQRTPIKMPIKPGAHTIVLRQNGVEVWRQELVAKPSADYVFEPSMAAHKQRERAQRQPPTVAGNPLSSSTTTTSDKPVVEPTPPKPAAGSAAAPITPAPTPVTPTPPPPVATGSAKPATPVVPTPPPREIAPATTAPQIVAPNQVTRVSGATPNLSKSKRADLPSVINAKVCIDVAGKVTEVTMMTKLERMTASDLSSTIRGWTYAPYKSKGKTVPVCFVVNFRAKE